MRAMVISRTLSDFTVGLKRHGVVEIIHDPLLYLLLRKQLAVPEEKSLEAVNDSGSAGQLLNQGRVVGCRRRRSVGIGSLLLRNRSRQGLNGASGSQGREKNSENHGRHDERNCIKRLDESEKGLQYQITGSECVENARDFKQMLLIEDAMSSAMNWIIMKWQRPLIPKLKPSTRRKVKNAAELSVAGGIVHLFLVVLLIPSEKCRSRECLDDDNAATRVYRRQPTTTRESAPQGGILSTGHLETGMFSKLAPHGSSPFVSPHAHVQTLEVPETNTPLTPALVRQDSTTAARRAQASFP